MLLTLFDPAVARSQGIPVHAVNLLLLVCSVLTMLCSVQAVGVILMLGLLVGPAATMYLLTDSYPKMLWGGAALGAGGAGAGLLVSYHLDRVPSGACIVLVLGAMFCLSFVFSPRYGLLARLKKSRHFHDESLARWPEKK
jgi:ABC-type Mn2+/Zn2+ transport system permease subunit